MQTNTFRIVLRTALVLAACLLAGSSPAQVDRAHRRLNRKLSEAVAKGDVAKMRRLLRLGADPNRHDNQGNTPLMIAAAQGNVEEARLLLAKRAQVNARGAYGLTPLIVSCGTIHANPALVQLLLTQGASVNAQEAYNGDSALSVAINHGYNTIVSLLLDHGAAIETRDKVGFTPLLHAVSSKDLMRNRRLQRFALFDTFSGDQVVM